MDSDSVDSIVTDPPYELGFMGKSWDNSGIAFSVELWTQVLRVLKPGGHLLAFSGSRTYHRMAVAIEDAGFEIRDQIQWVYGSGFPKSMDISKAIDKSAGAQREVVGINTNGVGNTSDSIHKEDGFASSRDKVFDITAPSTPEAQQWQGWGTALKPAHEPIVLARKPLIGTVAANVLTHGTGGLNIDGCRVAYVDGKDGGDWSRFEGHQSSKTIRKNMTEDGQKLLDGRIGNGKQEGRFPANFIHDGSEEVVALFPDSKSTQRTGKRTGKRTGILGDFRGQDDVLVGHTDSGSAARFFYCAKASKADRNEGLEGFEAKEIGAKGNGLARKCATCQASVLDGCECPDRTFINPAKANHHPTVKPTNLMRYLCRLITPPNGVVLDPFMGSGSTGKAAILEGFRFIGIDQSADYCEIAKARIDFAGITKEQDELFPKNYGRPEIVVEQLELGKIETGGK